MKRKKAKANRAKKAAAAEAARTSAPSPPRQVEQERLTIRARVSAFFSWSRVQPAPVVDDTNGTTSDLARGKKQRKRKNKNKNKIVHRQAARYAAPIESPAKRDWNQNPARREIPVGPTIAKLLENDAKIVEPCEQEFGHVDYLDIRSKNESGWDTCSACYFGQPSKIIVPIKKNNLDKHFDRKHKRGGARVRCSVCTAMLLTKHRKWHTMYCHPTLQ